MHRIDGPGATGDNKFTEGDPIGGVQATVVTDDWLNDVQEEILSVLADRSIAPVKGLQNQLLAAIKQITQSAPLPGVQGAAKNLRLSATGLSAAVSITADEIVVENTTNQYQTLRAVAVSPSFVASGANGLDVGAAGSQAAAQWYSVWVIWNGTTVVGLLSTSATAPTMPSGYTHKARVGWVRTDSTANKYPLCFDQAGRKVTMSPRAGTNVTGNIVMAQGVLGAISGAGSSVSVDNFIPPTAWTIEVFISTQTGSGGTVQVGRTGSLLSSVVLSITNEANQFISTVIGLDGTSRTLTFASSLAAGVLGCRGWEDNL